MNLLSQNNGPISMPLLSIGTAVDLTNSTYTATTSYNEEYPAYSSYVADIKNKVKQDCVINSIEIDS